MTLEFPLLLTAVSFVTVYGRLAGFFLFAPALGSSRVPVSWRALFPAVIAILVAPVLPAGWGSPTAGAALSLPLLTLLIFSEFLLGVVAALQAQFFLEIWRMTGELISTYIGLSFARQVDPSLDQEETIIGILLSQFCLVLFLMTGVHLEFIRLAVVSLQQVPPGALLSAADLAETSCQLAGRIFRDGLHLALPIVAVVLFIQVALGLISKFCQELEVLMLAFPLQLGLAFLLMACLAPVYAGVIQSHSVALLDQVAGWVAR